MDEEKQVEIFTPEQEDFMREALRLAAEAAAEGEVPVGAVAVWDGKIVGRGRNRRERGKNALSHAEIEALNEACGTLGGWRLHKLDLYVTLEPCPMCAGACWSARVKRIFYGAADPKAGAYGSVLDLNAYPLNHHPEIHPGLLEKEAAALLSAFFADLRQKRKEM